jgi:peptide/nickel transport system substrate-binding protein
MLAALAGTALARDIVVAQSSDLRSSNPGVNRDGNTDSIILHIVEGLVGYANNGEVKPLLAESVDMAPDGLSYTFKLRNDVKFHNGKVLTAEDVVWNWNRYMDPATKWTCLKDFDGNGATHVTGVKAVDASTVTMTLEKPSAVFLGLMSRPECGYTGIISPDSVAADGTFDKPIGTGPFQWDVWKKGEYLHLAKFDGYVSPKNDGKPDGVVGSKRPLVDGIKFMVIPDASTVKAGLQSGVLDTAEISQQRQEPVLHPDPRSGTQQACHPPRHGAGARSRSVGRCRIERHGRSERLDDLVRFRLLQRRAEEAPAL